MPTIAPLLERCFCLGLPPPTSRGPVSYASLRLKPCCIKASPPADRLWCSSETTMRMAKRPTVAMDMFSMHQVNTISPITLSTLLAVLTFGYAHTSLAEEVLKDHAYPDPPTWVQDAVAYEVNIRQYTPEGTFNAFRPELKRLQEMGVDVLWIMPIHPIGEKARSGQLGSYYAVRDYKAVNPEFGSPEDFKALVDEAHKLGMYVILDWVANHTAPDHPWVDAHPEWYTRDDAGNLVPPVPEWADVVDLDFAQRPLWDAMIDAMAHWGPRVRGGRFFGVIRRSGSRSSFGSRHETNCAGLSRSSCLPRALILNSSITRLTLHTAGT